MRWTKTTKQEGRGSAIILNEEMRCGTSLTWVGSRLVGVFPSARTWCMVGLVCGLVWWVGCEVGAVKQSLAVG